MKIADVVMTWVGGFIAGVVFMLTIDFDPAKTECESTLPRNVECVWAPPGEGNG